MAADYLIASLAPIPFEGPVPLSPAAFQAKCREALGYVPLAADDSRAPARAWRDLATQLKNAAALERARLLGVNGDKYLRPAQGCALYWRNRIVAAFAETDPLKRETALDHVWWDAAGALTPVTNPLSAGAAYTYLVRLEIAARRSQISIDSGNDVFSRISDARSAAPDQPA